MRIRLFRVPLPCACLAVAGLLGLVGNVRAKSDPVYSWSTTGNPPGVGINFTGTWNHTPQAGSTTRDRSPSYQQYGSGPSVTVGAPFQAFCIDLWHTEQTGNLSGNSSFTTHPQTVNFFAGTLTTSPTGGVAGVVASEYQNSSYYTGGIHSTLLPSGASGGLRRHHVDQRNELYRERLRDYQYE